MRYTYEEVLEIVRSGADELAETKYPEDLLNEWAQSCVSVYTAEIQRDWCDLDFEHQNRWEECFSLKDLGEDKGIDYLMVVDLAFYYEGLFNRAWREVERERDEITEAQQDCQHPSPADYGASQVKDGTLVHNCAECGLIMAWSVN